MCKFIMLVGLPGSGKSTYAKKLEEEGYRIHSSDAIREELTGDENTQTKNAEVFEILGNRVRTDLKAGKSCVYDATNVVSKRRRGFLGTLEKIDCVKECILFLTPIDECKRRNQSRERTIPEEVIEKMLRTFWVPMYYEGWDIISVISDNYTYRIPLFLCNGFDQKNRYHSLTLLEHMQQAMSYISNCKKLDKTSKRYKCLMTAALYHDIGKLYTQTFITKKGELTDDAHYYGHENYGTYLFLLHSFSGNTILDLGESFYTAALINWHMKPYVAWEQSEKAKKRDIAIIGEEMYKDIMMLHEADVAAH